MKILLDAMGGDNAPDANIKGAVSAINEVEAEVVLIGKEDVIRSKIKEFYGKEIEEISPRLKIHNATETIEMEDVPTQAIKTKKDSSMVVGFNMLKQGDGDVFISAGNSGALLPAGRPAGAGAGGQEILSPRHSGAGGKAVGGDLRLSAGGGVCLLPGCGGAPARRKAQDGGHPAADGEGRPAAAV